MSRVLIGNKILIEIWYKQQNFSASIFYITNKMQLIQCSLLSALYMFWAVFPLIIRSLWNCTCSL